MTFTSFSHLYGMQGGGVVVVAVTASAEVVAPETELDDPAEPFVNPRDAG